MASGSSYVGIHETAPCPEPGAFNTSPVGVCPPPMPGYTMPEPFSAPLSSLRGPESFGGRSRGPERSSNSSLTRSERIEALCGATADLVADLTHEVRARLQSSIPPHGSPGTIGASPHRVQAKDVPSGLTHTLSGERRRPMPTPAAVPRTPSCQKRQNRLTARWRLPHVLSWTSSG